MLPDQFYLSAVDDELGMPPPAASQSDLVRRYAGCIRPLSRCASFYHAGTRELMELILEDYPHTLKRARELVEQGWIRAFYKVSAPRVITALRERLVLVREIVDTPSCYESRDLGTEVLVLAMRS